MRHLDLFSGIGGFALAAQRVGWETIGFCEIDPYCQKVLQKHWPDVPIHGDIKTYEGQECDIITGGFPCQPYSVAGKQRGKEDDRDLWHEMFRVIQESKPTWVIGENVTGFVHMELERTFADLEGVGYEVQPLIIPAVSLDAKHQRDRVWVVGYSDSIGRPRRSKCKESAESPKSPTQGTGVLANPERIGQSGSREPLNPSNQKAGREGQAVNALDGCIRQEWPVEPKLGRVADGIPDRMDRLKGLGNAIVPQVAEVIFRAIDAVNPPSNQESDDPQEDQQPGPSKP